VYSVIYFNTFSLPCLNELYKLFYLLGKKTVPSNIDELLTVLALAYWICDDGGFYKRDRVVVLNTQGFSLEEVELLMIVLKQNFGLKCTIKKERETFAIRISSDSLSTLQALLKDVMPPMMLYKIGL
jgi:hypothetical protein